MRSPVCTATPPKMKISAVVSRMMVPYEQDRKGVEDFIVSSLIPICLGIDESESLLDSFPGILTCQTSIDEIIEHVHDNKCTICHSLKLLISFTRRFIMLIFRL